MSKRLQDLISSVRYRVLQRALLRSGSFDPEFYRSANPDVAAAGFDPLDHYIRLGRREGRQASPSEAPGRKLGLSTREIRKVSTDWETYSAILAASRDPDFLPLYRRVKASGLFDAEFYRRHAPAMRLSRDPLLDYQLWGWRQFWNPSPDFNTLFYLASFPEARVAGVSPLSHYLQTGKLAGYHTAPATESFEWVNNRFDPEDRNPSDDVHVEERKGASFFTRFGFGWEADYSDRYTNLAIAELAGRKPRLELGDTKPEISIVIPVYGQIHYLLNCLDSLWQHVSKYSVEILVMDDASPASWKMGGLAAIPWIKCVTTPENLGFVKNCNHGASLARGRYLVLLNSDTRVVSGWLDSLVETFEAHPKAALVGSKLHYGDGSLQECGGTVWRDGSAWNCGRGGDPNNPIFSHARQVDYCSGASIAIAREAWKQVGGFDIAYAPAYYEDVDIAFRLRQSGHEIWYQPWSRVIHYEGKTHGTNAKTGFKAYQERNRKLFYDRWHRMLTSHRLPGDSPLLETDYKDRPRVLVLDQLTPMPDKDAGSVVADTFLRMFQQEGWHVTFVPASFRYDGEYTARLQRAGIEVLYQPHYNDLRSVVNANPMPFDVILAFRVATLHGVLSELRKHYPQARIIFHNMDLHYLRTQRAAEIKGDSKLKIEAELFKDKELELVVKVDCSLVPSEYERDIIRQEVPVDNILVFPLLGNIRRSTASFRERRDICFVGGFAHDPNIDAVHYFVEDIWPLIKPQLPKGTRFHIVGPGAPASVQRLHGDGVVVAGHLPRLDEMFDQCRVFVAPLRYGAGVKGKLISSLSNGVPSVATSLATEGMGLVAGRDILVEDDSEAFAKAVVHLHSSEPTWLTIQTGGYAFIQEHCSWDVGMRAWKSMLDIADETWIGRHSQKRRRRLARQLKVNSAGTTSPTD
jgi:GT2 family glycosyltransferase